MSLRPTTEQSAAVDAFAAGGNVVLEAGAGTGKTATLRMIAELAGPNARGMYLAFNKSVAREAEGTFPRSVRSSTAHSLAYRAVMGDRAHRLSGPRLKVTEQSEILGLTGPTVVGGARVRRDVMTRAALGAVRAYTGSVDDDLGPQHVPPAGKGFAGRGAQGQAEYAAAVLPYARKAWSDLQSRDGKLRYEHDFYLKEWALTRPQLDVDYILFDEAQDADTRMLSVLLGQDTQIVAVGDRSQAIYSWRGAVDSMSAFDGTHCQLTQSWRFGQGIADEANVWLDLLDANLRLSGNPAITSTVGRGGRSDAVLCRTNGGLIGELLGAHDRNIPVAIAGESKKDLRELVDAAGRLREGHFAKHPDLNSFANWGELVAYVADDPSGSDLLLLVNLVTRHGHRPILRALDKTVTPDNAAVILTTAHTAKGLEWGRVRISDDFRPPKKDDDGNLEPMERDEAMLAYVSVTRAKDHLTNTGLSWVHTTPGLTCAPAPEPVLRQLQAAS